MISSSSAVARVSALSVALARALSALGSRQVRNVATDVFVQEAWRRGQSLSVHGWVYSLGSGVVNDQDVTVEGVADLKKL